MPGFQKMLLTLMPSAVPTAAMWEPPGAADETGESVQTVRLVPSSSMISSQTKHQNIRHDKIK